MSVAIQYLSGKARLADQISERITRVLDQARLKRAYRAERNRIHTELSAMSDRDLADIRVSRYDIPAIAEEGARSILRG